MKRLAFVLLLASACAKPPPPGIVIEKVEGSVVRFKVNEVQKVVSTLWEFRKGKGVILKTWEPKLHDKLGEVAIDEAAFVREDAGSGMIGLKIGERWAEARKGREFPIRMESWGGSTPSPRPGPTNLFESFALVTENTDVLVVAQTLRWE